MLERDKRRRTRRKFNGKETQLDISNCGKGLHQLKYFTNNRGQICVDGTRKTPFRKYFSEGS
jgi:hypothetical protein